MGFFDRRSLPAGLDSEIPKNERVMAWAQGPPRLDGVDTIVVTTDRALYAHGYVDRLPWEQVLHASWEDPILEAVRLDGRGSTDFMRITLDNAGSVPQVVFDRVTSTIVMRSRVELVGKRGATLVARRDREADEIRWEVVFDAGIDPSNPEFRARADEHLTWLRESAGI